MEDIWFQSDPVTNWIENLMTEDLMSMPRVGRLTAQCFINAGVSTTYALIGKFLTFRDVGISPEDHAERFWIWLTDVFKGHHIIKRDRAIICRAVCKRADILVPGLYDESFYEGFLDQEGK
jgi:hypothetical protein